MTTLVSCIAIIILSSLVLAGYFQNQTTGWVVVGLGLVHISGEFIIGNLAKRKIQIISDSIRVALFVILGSLWAAKLLTPLQASTGLLVSSFLGCCHTFYLRINTYKRAYEELRAEYAQPVLAQLLNRNMLDPNKVHEAYARPGLTQDERDLLALMS